MKRVHVPISQPQEKIKKAIILVHGLGGSGTSWTGSDNRFVERLMAVDEVKENFSIYLFEYPTNVFDPLSFWKKILAMIPSIGSKRKKTEDKFNADIRRLANVLVSDIRNLLDNYDSISFITHSMGGIVAKKALLALNDNISKISLYISLSVPHRGAVLATLGAKLLKNPQLDDLNLFGGFITETVRRYSELKSKPKAIYQSGLQDQIVIEGSAIPAGVTGDYIIETQDNHFTVLQIDDPDTNSVFRRILRELNIINVQFNSNPLANSPINFSIPNKDWTFKKTASALISTSSSTAEFIGFTDIELDTILEPNNISKENTYQAVMSLRHLGNNEIPEYDVIVEKNHFKIVKK